MFISEQYINELESEPNSDRTKRLTKERRLSFATTDNTTPQPQETVSESNLSDWKER